MTALDVNAQPASDRRSEQIVTLTAAGGCYYTMINTLCSIYPNVVVAEECHESKWAATIRRGRRLGPGARTTRQAGRVAPLEKAFAQERAGDMPEYRRSESSRKRHGHQDRIGQRACRYRGGAAGASQRRLGDEFRCENLLYHGQMGGCWAGWTTTWTTSDRRRTSWTRALAPGRRSTRNGSRRRGMTDPHPGLRRDPRGADRRCPQGNPAAIPAKWTSVLRFPPPIWDCMKQRDRGIW
jgi:hypothetical protein